MRLGSGCRCVYIVSEHPINKKNEIKRYKKSKNKASRYEVNRIARRYLWGCIKLRGKVDSYDLDVANRVRSNRGGLRQYYAGDLTTKRHAFILKEIAIKGWKHATVKQQLIYFGVEE